jgi:diguanylate cyclase (GGDEF)-like protein
VRRRAAIREGQSDSEEPSKGVSAVVIALAVLVLLTAIALASAAMRARAATRAQNDLEHLATHDGLTGHDVGDQLMVAASGQITKALLPTERLFRLGGPQFLILCPASITRDAALERAAALQEAVRVQYRIDHDQVRISSSVGVVLLDQRHQDADVVLADAESALREANRTGPGTAVAFEVAMRSKINPYDAEVRLRRALENHEFLLMYMPVVTLDDSRIAGVEAVIRWADPEHGVIAPSEFFELLEDTDLLGPVGEWILREACAHTRRWAERFPGLDLVTTINVSPAQLANPDYIDWVIAILAELRVDPARVCLEITEGSVRKEIDVIWWSLRRAKEAGIQLALDDFGTGYSTFDYIRKFHLDVLKIDKVFIDRINDSTQDYAIVQQIISLAHALDLVAIAEGVDDAEQARALAGLNCDLGQGYYWSQPQPLEAIEKLLERGGIRPAANRAKKIDWKAPSSPTA